MTLQVILPTKRVIDVRPFIADFAPFLASGETISSVFVVVSVYTGEDASPSDLLYLPADINGTEVEQRLRAGIPGNIYQVTMTVTTSEDNELSAEAFQAVIPDGVPAFDIFIPFPLTTTPYPLNLFDDFESGASIRDAYDLQPDIGAFELALSVLSGTLRDQLQFYSNWPAEALDHSLSIPASGELRTVLLSYSNAAPEGIDHSLAFGSGNLLRAALIAYTLWPAEGFDHSCSILSGSLV